MLNIILREIKRNVAINLIFALFLLSLLILPTQSQKVVTESKLNYDNDYEVMAFQNGSIIHRDNHTKFSEISLSNVKLFGYKNASSSVELPEFEIDTSNTIWVFSPAKENIIELKSDKIKILLDTSARNLDYSVSVLGSLPNNGTKYNYTDYKYKYEFYYSSDLNKYYNYVIGDKTFRASGVDTFSFNNLKPEDLIMNEKYITILNNNCSFTQAVIHSNEKEIITIKQGDITANIKTFGGETVVVQPSNTNFPSTIDVSLMNAYEINDKNRINKNTMDLINYERFAGKPFFNKTDHGDKINSFNWKNQKGDSNITQFITVVTQDYTQYNFTNQEKLVYKDANFNLGPGPFVINKGDQILTYEINGFNFCTTENQSSCPSNYGASKYFEMPIMVSFPDEKYKNIVNNGEFYTYANLISTDETAKLVSVNINNVYNAFAVANKNNYIYVRTTPFKGTAQIQILFKFFDEKKKTVLVKKTSEKLIFENVGGQFLYTNSTWDINDESALDNMLYRKFQVDSIVEEAKGKEIRSYSTKKLYYAMTDSSNGRFVANSLVIEDNSRMTVNFEPIKRNDTKISHKYLDKNGTELTQSAVFNDGEIYINFNFNWTPCNNKTKTGILPITCQSKESDKISAKFYLNKMTQEIDDLKPVKNDTDKDEVERDLKIELTYLNGNYESSSSNDIDNLEDYTESIVKFDFNPNGTNLNRLNGGFKVKYVYKIPEPKDGNNAMLYILIAVGLILLVAGVVYFVHRRQNMRKESANRLVDSQNV